MYYLVCYDISSNRTRRIAIKYCKLAGLVRVQRSVFTGASTHLRIQEISNQLAPLLQPKTDSLSIQSLDATAWRRWQVAGKTLDKTAIAKQRGAVFF
ncbi:MAG: CRISPR-associated endonuclease Cas2 [Lewinellaceae bacterium]|nr:CRISPR-associated endonuclease Cas2 [Saprospiraceae bacterium]MCB9338555.1 CRISPR-associated endonuclease Cas2 [Lewinellaceae bacterium]